MGRGARIIATLVGLAAFVACKDDGGKVDGDEAREACVAQCEQQAECNASDPMTCIELTCGLADQIVPECKNGRAIVDHQWECADADCDGFDDCANASPQCEL